MGGAGDFAGTSFGVTQPMAIAPPTVMFNPATVVGGDGLDR